MKYFLSILTLLIISTNGFSQDTDFGASKINYSDGTVYTILSTTSDSIVSTKNKTVEYTVTHYSQVTFMQPYFALKTNLLYDLATALNVELEIPIKQRWSITAEYIFPWWQREKSDFTMQLLSGQLGLNYWFGDRSNKKILTGWHLGVFGGFGKYDFQFFNVNGNQGRFFSSGISAGYSHSIARNLRLEYQLGVGVISSKNKNYDKVRNTRFGNIKVFRYPWETKKVTWIGPTQLRVSLVWMLNHKTKKGGNK